MGKKRKYKIWTEPNEKVDPRTAELLRPVVLDHAILDNITCPSVGEVPADVYVRDLAVRLHDPIWHILKSAGTGASEPQLQEICRGAAGEVLVIRGLLELLMDEEIHLQEIQHLPFFKAYEDYFKQTPEIVSRTLYLALSVAADDQNPEPTEPPHGQN